MKTLAFIITVLSIPISIYAQDTTIIYFNQSWQEIKDPDIAAFYRKAFKDTNNIWQAHDYYMSGTIQMTGSFKSKRYEKQKGRTTYYYENGQKSAEGEFVNGQWSGEWTRWYETGELKEKGSYEKGNQVGVWSGWHKNGNPSYVRSIEDYSNAGNWEIYYESGELMEKNRFTDTFTVFVEGYHKNGILSYKGRIITDQRHGLWKNWNEEGRLLAEGEFKNGERDGKWIRYFKDGKVKLEYKKGVLSSKTHGGMVRRK